MQNICSGEKRPLGTPQVTPLQHLCILLQKIAIFCKLLLSKKCSSASYCLRTGHRKTHRQTAHELGLVLLNHGNWTWIDMSWVFLKLELRISTLRKTANRTTRVSVVRITAICDSQNTEWTAIRRKASAVSQDVHITRHLARRTIYCDTFIFP